MRALPSQERPSKAGSDGRYTIVKKLADGGMAEIFLATQSGAEGFERQVILKRILPALSADPQFRNMLVDEAHVAMGLRHSNIVQVLDFGEADGRTFLVLELVDGWDLHSILTRAKAARIDLPLGLALHVVAEVCRGLAYAHRSKRAGRPVAIVHRDISPQNVLISGEGEVKLADFGIAKALGRRERTQAGVIKGKLDFMSPEQAAGVEVDARSDIFSLGTVLYLLVTGERPITGATELETLLKVQNAEFTPPEDVRRDLPAKVAAIVHKAMCKLPSARYRDAEAMLDDVERVLQNDFRAAGPSELKRWLETLAKRDRATPISHVAGHSDDRDGTRAAGKTLALRPTQKAPGRGPSSEEPRSSTPHAWEERPQGRSRLFRLATTFVVLGGAIAAGFWLYAPHKGRSLIKEGQRAIEGARTAGVELAEKLQEQAFPPASPAPAEKPQGADELAVDRPAPVPSKRARPATVDVQLSSRPAGAVVRTKRGRLGTTPVTVPLAAGVTHELVFTKPGFATTKRRLRADNDGVKVAVELASRKRKRRR